MQVFHYNLSLCFVFISVYRLSFSHYATLRLALSSQWPILSVQTGNPPPKLSILQTEEALSPSSSNTSVPWLHSSWSTSFLYWGTQAVHSTYMWSNKHQAAMKNPFPQSIGCASLDTAQDAAGSHLAHYQANTPVLLTELLPSLLVGRGTSCP